MDVPLVRAEAGTRVARAVCESGGLVSREEKEFLFGFEKAALLAQQILHSPPAYTTAREYLESVAHLHRDSDDLVCRGLVVGCLSALGNS
jgi:hypothetical protein